MAVIDRRKILSEWRRENFGFTYSAVLIAMALGLSSIMVQLFPSLRDYNPLAFMGYETGILAIIIPFTFAIMTLFVTFTIIKVFGGAKSSVNLEFGFVGAIWFWLYILLLATVMVLLWLFMDDYLSGTYMTQSLQMSVKSMGVMA